MITDETPVTLQPITMITPTTEGIYAPSRIRQPVQMSDEEFLSEWADRGVGVLVSFALDGVSDPRLMTAYGLWNSLYIQQED